MILAAHKLNKYLLFFFLLCVCVQVVMMVLPLLIFVLLPKVVNTSDPDMRRVSRFKGLEIGRTNVITF